MCSGSHPSPRLPPQHACRLAKQAALYYTECSRLLSSPPLNQHFDRSWLAHALVKSQLYEVESTVQNSAALRDADPIAGVAKEIARLRVGGRVVAEGDGVGWW